MKHYPYDEWLLYVQGDINEKLREEYESHLYACDECLEHYLQAVGAHESSLPILTNEVDFTDLVMAGVKEQRMAEEKLQPQLAKSKKPFYQHAAFHYLLAAAATLLLTFSGVFQFLASYASSVEGPGMKERRPSVTEGVIDKTFAWMDSLEVKEEVNKK
nr:hypothetical protein [Neobacillus sp. Marseille-Q6967]